MDGEINGGDSVVGGRFPPAGELLVVDHRLWMQQVKMVVQESQSEGVAVVLRPGVVIHRKLVHVLELDANGGHHDEQGGGEAAYAVGEEVSFFLHGMVRF